MADTARLLGALVVAAKGTGNSSPPRWDALGKAQRFTGGWPAAPAHRAAAVASIEATGGQRVLLLC